MNATIDYFEILEMPLIRNLLLLVFIIGTAVFIAYNIDVKRLGVIAILTVFIILFFYALGLLNRMYASMGIVLFALILYFMVYRGSTK